MNQDIFTKQLRKGKIGEEVIEELMKKRGHKVISVANDERFFQDDIDFIIDDYKCELKTDYKISKTGNLFLEAEMYYFSDGRREKGYFYKTKADYLFYFDINNQTLLIYKMSDLKKYVHDSKNYCKMCEVDDGYKIITGYVIPYNNIQHQEIQIKEVS